MEERYMQCKCSEHLEQTDIDEFVCSKCGKKFYKLKLKRLVKYKNN